jgi:phosphoglycerate dehydrogenase-like enzyme
MCCQSESKGDSGSLRTGLLAPLSSNGWYLLPKGKMMTDTVMLPAEQLRLIANASESQVEPSGRLSAHGEIGFIGLGHMGTAMAANLAAAGYRVIAYVRHPDQTQQLAALGLDPTTQIADLFDCWVVVSIVPDDSAVRDIVLGREDAGVKASLRD